MIALALSTGAGAAGKGSTGDSGGGKRQKVDGDGKAVKAGKVGKAGKGKVKAKATKSQSRPSKPDALLSRIHRECDLNELNAYLLSLNDGQRARELAYVLFVAASSSKLTHN